LLRCRAGFCWQDVVTSCQYTSRPSTQQDSLLVNEVAYPWAADNVARPLVRRLKGLHHPVVRARIRFSAPRSAVYLHPADKYYRLTRRPSQEQKGLVERAIMASQWPSHPW